MLSPSSVPHGTAPYNAEMISCFRSISPVLSSVASSDVFVCSQYSASFAETVYPATASAAANSSETVKRSELQPSAPSVSI